jgi:hypothetical protein
MTALAEVVERLEQFRRGGALRHEGGERALRGLLITGFFMRALGADSLRRLITAEFPLAQAAEAFRMQGAHAIVISRGPDGLLAVTEEGVWQAAPPERLGGNPTGAEDAAGVALVAGIADGSPRPQRLADTLALRPQPCARRRPPVLTRTPTGATAARW